MKERWVVPLSILGFVRSFMERKPGFRQYLPDRPARRRISPFLQKEGSAKCLYCKREVSLAELQLWVVPAGKSFFCSDLCKAKKCVYPHESGCWLVKAYTFTSSGRSFSVRAYLYCHAVSIAYDKDKTPKPHCGNKSCVHPQHLSRRNLGIIDIESL